MKVKKITIFSLLYLLSPSAHAARWGLSGDEAFGMALAIFVIILINYFIVLLGKWKHIFQTNNAVLVSSFVTGLVIIFCSFAFSVILIFFNYTSSEEYRFYWLFGTLLIVFIATVLAHNSFNIPKKQIRDHEAGNE